MRTCVILNPMANKGGAGKRWPELEKRLKSAIGEVEVLRTERRGEGIELTRSALAKGARRFVAVGGDGTANEVVNGLVADDRLVAPDIVLAHIPAGTSNELSRGLGQAGQEAPFDALASGRTRAIDVFRADSTGADGRPIVRYGFLTASLGAPATISQRAQAVPLLKRLGPFAYILTTVAVALGYGARQVSLSIDGAAPRTVPLWSAMTCSSEAAGEGLMIAPGARMDDGRLDLVMTGDLTRSEALFKIIPGIRDGSYVRHPKVTRASVREVAFSSAETIPVDIDGEAMGVLPLRLRLLPWQLPVAVV
jgi:diacylglycerol kinase family enzyme